MPRGQFFRVFLNFDLQLSDTFGRKKGYFAVVALLGVAGTISGFSPNWQFYAAMRFFVGVWYPMHI